MRRQPRSSRVNVHLPLAVLVVFTVIFYQSIGAQAFIVDEDDLDTPETVGLGSPKQKAAASKSGSLTSNAGASEVDGTFGAHSHVKHSSISASGRDSADLLPGPDLTDEEPPSVHALDTKAVPALDTAISAASLASSAASGSHSVAPAPANSSVVGQIHAIEVKGAPQTGLYVALDLGTPSQTLNLLIDTGSTTNAVACEAFEEIDGEHFETSKSSTWRSHNKKLHERYAKGWWKGTHGSDVVALSTDAGEKRVRMQLACIEESGEFFPPAEFPGGWHGILGLGYDYLGIPRRQDKSNTSFMSSIALALGTANSFGILLCPADPAVRRLRENIATPIRGQMVLGESRAQPPQAAAPLLDVRVIRRWYYEVVIGDVLIGDRSLNQHCHLYNRGKTLLDTGSTLILLNNRFYQYFVKYMVNNVPLVFKAPDRSGRRTYYTTRRFWRREQAVCAWSETGDKAERELDWAAMPSMTFALALNSTSVLHLVVPPQSLISASASDDGETICYTSLVLGTAHGTIIGATALRGTYTLYDRERDVVGFAEADEASCAGDKTGPDAAAFASSIRSRVRGPFNVDMDMNACIDPLVPSLLEALVFWFAVLLTVALVVTLVVLLVCCYCWRRNPQYERAESSQDAAQSQGNGANAVGGGERRNLVGEKKP